VLAVCTAAYAVIGDYRVLLAAVIVHGLFWSALLSASGAYMAAAVPVSRRAEGLGYWGLASVLAIAVAPPIGFWVYHLGWRALCADLTALNVLMTIIAWRLPEEDAAPNPPNRFAVEWRVLLLSITLSLVSFGYGSLTSFSALFADELGVAPRSLFLTVMAVAILLGRLTLGRHIDQVGHRRVLVPCLIVPAAGLIVLATASGRASFLCAAALFGAGFGLMYPAFVAYVIHHVAPGRRGAAFGAILAAFDTGIGTGSTVLGYLIHDFGFRPAYAVAAGLAVLSLPYFMVMERRLGFAHERSSGL
jgi:predicted MFS family arabinose efflux permease